MTRRAKRYDAPRRDGVNIDAATLRASATRRQRRFLRLASYGEARRALVVTRARERRRLSFGWRAQAAHGARRVSSAPARYDDRTRATPLCQRVTITLRAIAHVARVRRCCAMMSRYYGAHTGATHTARCRYGHARIRYEASLLRYMRDYVYVYLSDKMLLLSVTHVIARYDDAQQMSAQCVIRYARCAHAAVAAA